MPWSAVLQPCSYAVWFALLRMLGSSFLQHLSELVARFRILDAEMTAGFVGLEWAGACCASQQAVVCSGSCLNIVISNDSTQIVCSDRPTIANS